VDEDVDRSGGRRTGHLDPGWQVAAAAAVRAVRPGLDVGHTHPAESATVKNRPDAATRGEQNPRPKRRRGPMPDPTGRPDRRSGHPTSPRLRSSEIAPARPLRCAPSFERFGEEAELLLRPSVELARRAGQEWVAASVGPLPLPALPRDRCDRRRPTEVLELISISTTWTGGSRGRPLHRWRPDPSANRMALRVGEPKPGDEAPGALGGGDGVWLDVCEK
jgi:hypothetical protein